MHHAIIFSVAVAFSVCIFHAFVNAESCTVGTDCTSTACSSGFHVVCEHDPATGVTANGGLCTCAVDNLNCTTAAECKALPNSTLQCISNNHRHCYDNKCICTRW